MLSTPASCQKPAKGRNMLAVYKTDCFAWMNANQMITFRPSFSSVLQQSVMAQLQGITNQQILDENQVTEDLFWLKIIRHYIANYYQWDCILRNPFHTKARHIALFWDFNADRQTEAWKTSMSSWKISFAFNLDKSLVRRWYVNWHVKDPRMVAPHGEMPCKDGRTNSGLGCEQCHWASTVLYLAKYSYKPRHISPCKTLC